MLIQQLMEQLSMALQANVELAQRITELEQRLGRNSRNSSAPPSSDGFNRPPPRPRSLRSLRQPTSKKPGGQPGHKGKTLRFSDHPDQVVEHRPGECAEFARGCPLEDVPAIAAVEGASCVERRQVVDLPPLKLQTTEHQTPVVRCPLCSRLNKAPFPAEAPDAVQYGPHLKAVGVYLMSYQLLPMGVMLGCCATCLARLRGHSLPGTAVCGQRVGGGASRHQGGLEGGAGGTLR